MINTKKRPGRVQFLMYDGHLYGCIFKKPIIVIFKEHYDVDDFKENVKQFNLKLKYLKYKRAELINGNYNSKAIKKLKKPLQGIFYELIPTDGDHKKRNERFRLFCKKMKELGSELKTSIEKKCDYCGNIKGKLKKCTGCDVTYYCNLKCQIKDWKIHKTNCFI